MTPQQDWRAALGALIAPSELPAQPDNAADETPAPERQTARLDVIVERKGRGGKVATIISGFTVSDAAVDDIASRLKRTLGTGGSARGGEILIQGDRADAVLKALTEMGLKARKI